MWPSSTLSLLDFGTIIIIIIVTADKIRYKINKFEKQMPLRPHTHTHTHQLIHFVGSDRDRVAPKYKNFCLPKLNHISYESLHATHSHSLSRFVSLVYSIGSILCPSTNNRKKE